MNVEKCDWCGEREVWDTAAKHGFNICCECAEAAEIECEECGAPLGIVGLPWTPGSLCERCERSRAYDAYIAWRDDTLNAIEASLWRCDVSQHVAETGTMYVEVSRDLPNGETSRVLVRLGNHQSRADCDANVFYNFGEATAEKVVAAVRESLAFEIRRLRKVKR